MTKQIREATSTDFKNLLKLHRQLYRQHRKFDKTLETDLELDKKWISARINDTDTKIFVVEQGQKIVAYVIGEIESANLGVISEIYVQAKSRQKGFGRQLLKEAFLFFNKMRVNKIITATPRGNLSSILFWGKLDFVQSSNQPDPHYIYFEYLIK
jgi:ribosomal protein S18 acetylase RimI-like enzyme